MSVPTSIHRGPSLASGHAPTLPALLLDAVARHAARPALGRATSADRLTFADLARDVARAAALLDALGVRPGDRVGLLSENRPEWAVVDHAVLSLGAVVVPVYPSLPAAQVAEVLGDSGARVVFASGSAQARKVDGAVERVLDLDALASALPAEDPAWTATWRARARAVAPDDLATLIYTSGTTGTPKGVMLTHGALAAMVAATRQQGALTVVPGEIALSILPLSHVFERAAAYFFLAAGATTVYAESMQTVPRDLVAVAPHHMVAVPRLFEKVHDAVVGAPGVKGRIARAAAATARAWSEATTHGRRPAVGVRLRHALADRLVYAVLRRRMGGRMRTFICGGAPLDPRVGALFLAAGLPVYEGYGLTETSPVIAANGPGAVRLGAVGRPFPGVEVRLGEADEIQVRGPGVTRGYWNRPEATAAAFTADGWFRTGDVGALDADGFLRVVDRLKDLIVTAGGKNVAPQPLEQRGTGSPLAVQAVLLGDRRPYLVLLVVPDFAALARRAAGEGWGAGADPATEAGRAALAAEPRAGAALAAEVAGALRDAASVERPKRLAVLTEEFTVEGGLMTPTLKVRRRAVEAHHAELLDALYAGRSGVEVPWPRGH